MEKEFGKQEGFASQNELQKEGSEHKKREIIFSWAISCLGEG